MVSLIVEPDSKLAKKDYEFAVKWASRAVELSQHKERDCLDTLSRAYLGRGDKVRAVVALKEAIDLTTLANRDPWLERLKEYER